MTDLADDVEQLEWMRAQLARHAHRPGWEFTLRPGVTPGRAGLLVVRWADLDSRNPDRMIKLRAHRDLSPTRDPDQFSHAVLAALDSINRHETREWFRRDGVLFADPHTDTTLYQCAPCRVTGPPRREGGSWTCPDCNGRQTS